MVANVICNCWHCASLVVFVRVCRRRRRDARRSGHIGVLSSATAGRLERSDRCDRVLLPLGLRTRLALVDGFTCWGARCSASQDPPTSADARAAASLGSALPGGLRLGQVPDAVSVDTTAEGPGLMILDDELEILAITPNAERWLEELQDEWSGLPDPIRSVAACVRQMENADGAEDQTPRARGRSGRWLVIHGSLTGERDGRATGTAIMLEEAKPSEIAPSSCARTASPTAKRTSRA